MKYILFFLLVLIFSCGNCSGQSKIRSNPENFVYAAYCAPSRLKDSTYVTGLDFSRFNFYYILSYPKWDPIDFDKPQDSIIQKYVTDYDYPCDGTGLGLTKLFIDSAHAASSKVLLSLQGTSFIDIVRSEQRRGKFAKMIAEFVRKFNYDGFDLDWEGTLDLELHYLFMKGLRRELNHFTDQYYFLTTAIAPSKAYTADLADLLSKEIDWINIMTYDMGGGIWDNQATYNTPMERIKKRLQNWSVFNPSKLCIGLASYGYLYENLEPGQRIARNTKMSDYGKSISYIAFADSLKNGWVEKWDEQEQVAYYYSPNGEDFITIDNFISISRKLNWGVDQGYRGVFWWELYDDYVKPENKYGEGKLLLKGDFKENVRKVLHGQ